MGRLPKAKGFVHPRSREAGRQKHLEAREQKLISHKRETVKKARPTVNMLKFFKEELEKMPETAALTPEENLEFAEIFFQSTQKDPETTKKEDKKRVKKVSLKERMMQVSAETRAENFYNGTFDVPDLRTAANVFNLRQWDGKEQSLGLIKLVSISTLTKATEQL